MRSIRRFLVLAGLMFWIGGFTFYAAVVVPVGTARLGATDQGEITRIVTNYLNLSGIVALALLLWDLWSGNAAATGRWRVRGLCWLIMVVGLAALALLHIRMDDILNNGETQGDWSRTFRPLHRIYLWTSTVQWAAALVYLAMSVRTWK